MPKLTVFLPDSGEVNYDLPEGTITLGRVAGNDIQIEDSSISSHHAEITVRGGRVFIKDLGSTNGTTINGGEVTESPFKVGDTLMFGSVQAELQGEASGSLALPEIAEAAFVAPSSSNRPSGFVNASPYPKRRASIDGPTKGVIAAAVVAVLAAGAAIALAMTITFTA
jgi:pSer/pThr/pTyr-binding forkhead associated (FHA) protein